ncbi:MAG: hypothetical protein OSB30_04600 [Candidatus Poseidoniaceae archaeon]|nr:hypothetical protein [Candidatus Poseidoniaceae archaeon]
MDAIMQAAFWFWFPAIALVVGTGTALSSKSDLIKKLSKIIAVIGFVMVLFSPVTVPESPSSAAGHLLGSIVGPCALLVTGIYLLAFSGNVEVGKLSSTDRKIGSVCTFLGLVWLEGMHWWTWTPMLNGEVNPYWLVFWPTFLLLSTGLSSGAAFSLRYLGDSREQESNFMLVISSLTFTLTALGMILDGPNISAEIFRDSFWLAVSDIFGLGLGVGLSILVFAFVIWVYESSLPPTKSLDAPSQQELVQASSIVAKHIGGEQE